MPIKKDTETNAKQKAFPLGEGDLRRYYFARLVPEMLRAGVHQRGVCEAAWKLAGEMVETSTK